MADGAAVEEGHGLEDLLRGSLGFKVQGLGFRV